MMLKTAAISISKSGISLVYCSCHSEVIFGIQFEWEKYALLVAPPMQTGPLAVGGTILRRGIPKVVQSDRLVIQRIILVNYTTRKQVQNIIRKPVPERDVSTYLGVCSLIARGEFSHKR